MVTHWTHKQTVLNSYHFIKITSWDLICPSNLANLTDHVTFFSSLLLNWTEEADRTGMEIRSQE